MTLNVCQAGHETHESELVDTLYGPFWVWRWRKYMDFAGYCTGQDEVSKSIDLQKVWERADSELFLSILRDQRGTVLDFGSHIGWFTNIALAHGCDVSAFDSDPENMRLLQQNTDRWRGIAELFTTLAWVGDLSPLKNPDHVRIFKSDLEGHEHEALNLTRQLWQERKIDYGLWELSPIFEKRPGIMAESYAALVDEIASYGYRWFILKGDDQWEITGADLTFPQENAWAEKR